MIYSTFLIILVFIIKNLDTRNVSNLLKKPYFLCLDNWGLDNQGCCTKSDEQTIRYHAQAIKHFLLI